MTGAVDRRVLGVTVTFLVKGAEASGIAPGPAGLLLTAGSAVGIASRLLQGRWADRGQLVPIRRVALLRGSAGRPGCWARPPSPPPSWCRFAYAFSS